MQIQPYLFFDGRCEEAITFYRKALGAEVVMLMRYGDSPAGEATCPDGTQPPPDKVMHACLQIGSDQLLLSDGFSGGHPEFTGFSLSLSPLRPVVAATPNEFGVSLRHAAADSVTIAAAVVTFTIRAVGVLLPVSLMFGVPALGVVLLLRRRQRKLALDLVIDLFLDIAGR